MQFAGVNYLVPVDAELRDEADLRRMTRADQILADLQQAKNLRILVLDACRDNPFAEDLKRSIGRSRASNLGRGLAKMESPDGTIISYATQSGRTADDGAGRNSPYTGAFLKRIVEKDNVTAVFQHIGADVYENTKGAQVPELSLSFFGEYYLNGKAESAAAPTSVVTPRIRAQVQRTIGKAQKLSGRRLLLKNTFLGFRPVHSWDLPNLRLPRLRLPAP